MVKGTPKEGLIGATLGFFIGFAAVALFGPTAVKFQEIMGLSPLSVGLLVAMPSLSGSLLRIPFAAWVDRTGGRKPFLILLLLSVVGMTGLLLIILKYYPNNLSADLYPLLLLLGLLCGCGIASFSVGISQVSYWYPQGRQGIALGAFAGYGNLAPGIFSFLFPVVLVGIGLSGAYSLWLLFLIVGTVLYFFLGRNAWYFQFLAMGSSKEDAKKLARERGQELFPLGGLRKSLAVSAKTWKTWALVGIYFTTFGGFIALTAWFPMYWTAYFGVSVVSAGIFTASFSILSSLIRIVGGKISDRLGGEKTAKLSLLFVLMGALILTCSSNLYLSFVGALTLAAGMGVANAAVFKLVPQEVPQAVGGAAGWVGGMGAFGGFVIPLFMGFLVTLFGTNGYATGFVIFIALAGASLGLAAALQRASQREVVLSVQ